MYQNIYFDIKTKKVHLWDDIKGYESFKFKPYAYKKDPKGKYTSLFFFIEAKDSFDFLKLLKKN